MPRPISHRTELHAGDLRLLHDVAVLETLMEEPREPARVRVERALGADLARALRASLVDAAAKAA